MQAFSMRDTCYSFEMLICVYIRC